MLAVYTRPYAPKPPQGCMDEVSKQWLRDVRAALPRRPGQPARVDYEYERGGVVNCFLVCEPRAGRRWVAVTEHRTKEDWAHQIKELVEVRYPQAERIVLGLDKLNTHTPGALEVVPPSEAQRLADKFGDPLHAPAREWAQHRRDRTERAQSAVPGPSRPGLRDARGGSGRLARPPQCHRRDAGLAVHHRRRAHQTQAPVPFTSRETEC